jgi:hypothetical protein
MGQANRAATRACPHGLHCALAISLRVLRVSTVNNTKELGVLGVLGVLAVPNNNRTFAFLSPTTGYGQPTTGYRLLPPPVGCLCTGAAAVSPRLDAVGGMHFSAAGVGDGLAHRAEAA